MPRNLALLLVLFLVAQPARPAQIELTESGHALLSGRIEDGDAEKLIVVQRQRRKTSGQFLSTIVLSSPGGSVAEAVKLASVVEAFRLNASVQGGSVCVSSCFIVFIAGSSRNALAFESTLAGRVGVHRPYFDFASVRDSELPALEGRQRQLMQDMQQFLRQRSVPQELVEKMMRLSSKEVHWLTDADLVAVGAFSPIYDQLVTAKCGRTPDFGRTLADPSAAPGHDNSTTKMDEVAECERKLVRRLRSAELPPVLSRMASGWRPWSK